MIVFPKHSLHGGSICILTTAFAHNDEFCIVLRIENSSPWTLQEFPEDEIHDNTYHGPGVPNTASLSAKMADADPSLPSRTRKRLVVLSDGTLL